MSRTAPILILCLGVGLCAWMLVSTLAPADVALPPVAPEPGDEPAPEPLLPIPGPAPEPAPEEEVQRGSGSIRGTVTAQDTGAPVDDARVIARFGRKNWSVRTDGAGAFLLADLPAGKWAVEVRATAHQDHSRTSLDLAAGEEAVVDVALQAGAVLTGRVLDRSSGAGIAGARVGVHRQDHKVTRSGPDGAYRLPGLTAGTVIIEARADTYPPVLTTVNVTASSVPTERDLSLVKGATVSGTVTDSRGAPLADVDVSVRTHATVKAKTGADGRFTLTPLPPERSIRVNGEREGRASARSAPLVLAVGETLTGVRLVLPAGASIEGVVMSGEEGPAAGATVLAHSSLPEYRGMRPPRAVTDEAGRFSLYPLPPGDLRLMAVKTGALQTTLSVSALEEGETRTGVELRLLTGQSISGRVVDGTGKPVAKAIVSARPMAAEGPARWGSARTDADGNFIVQGLGEGTYTLSARLPNGGGEAVTREVRGGEEDVLLTLPTPGIVSGRVVDPGGKPVSSFTITGARVAEGRRGTRMVFQRVKDESGKFRLEGVAPGTYSFAAGTEAGHSASLPSVIVVGGEETRDLVLTLAAGGTIGGAVVDPGGRRMSGASVTAVRLEGRVGSFGGRTTKTDFDGSFELSGLPVGRYRVRAVAQGLVAESDEVRVESEVVVQLVVSMPGTGRLKVRVVDAKGHPIEGAWVNLSDERGRGIAPRVAPVSTGVSAAERGGAARAARARALRTGADGVCVREGVPEGRITVRVIAADHAPALKTVPVEAGGAAEVTLELVPGSPGPEGEKLFPGERR